MGTPDRDFSAISPSAKALLLMKGYTTIPFARAAAALSLAPEPYEPDPDHKDLAFWARTAHFESRYYSIDQLMEDIDPAQVLELSAGFSLRGLALTQDRPVHYLDTDLPELIRQKQAFIEALRQEAPAPRGQLELRALNALDAGSFAAAMSRFDKRPVTIVNEGLLMYLNPAEKQQLAAIIHKTLKEYGGCWITADVYLKQPPGAPSMRLNDQLQHFLDRHHVEENKFDSEAAARSFFEAAGFIVDREAHIDHTTLSAYPELMKQVPPELQDRMRQAGKMQLTWRLRAV